MLRVLGLSSYSLFCREKQVKHMFIFLHFIGIFPYSFSVCVLVAQVRSIPVVQSQRGPIRLAAAIFTMFVV